MRAMAALCILQVSLPVIGDDPARKLLSLYCSALHRVLTVHNTTSTSQEPDMVHLRACAADWWGLLQLLKFLLPVASVGMAQWLAMPPR